jgi:CRISPR/Cas system-associated exonuclease Cas4 (RecB family)
VKFTDKLRDELIDILDEMREARTLADVHLTPDTPRRCTKCRMQEICNEALYEFQSDGVQVIVQ